MKTCASFAVLTLLITLLPAAWAGPKGVEIIGHRGASFDAPENTLAALRLAWEQSADAVEFDVYLSKDGHVVLFHDPDTRRTAGVPGKVAEQTLAELRRLDVGSWKTVRFKGERVPTLAEALATVPRGKRVFIEVKCGPEIVPELKKVLAAAKLEPRQTAVISFSAEVVAAVKKALPNLQVYWIVSLGKDEKPKWTAEGLLQKARSIQADGLDLSAHPTVTAAFVQGMNAAGLPVYVWTVNDASQALRLIEAGVAGITTDRPGWLRSRLAGAPERAPEMRVMSFNIRYGTARDGVNSWDKRKEFLVETVRAFDPDLLGTQETLAFQRDYLAEKLPGYAVLGVGREGKDKGEMVALYYRTERFEKLADGHFWLSETPERVGSKSWDSSLPRMVTWVKLRDRKAPGAAPVLLFNTHFDHRGSRARLESARLLRRQIATLAKGCAVILTGDFNGPEGSPPYQALFGDEGGQPALVDTFRKAHPKPGKAEGTFSGFKASASGGARLDWIGCSRDWEVKAGSIDRTARDGRTPSDHFPVTAVLRR